MRTRRHCIQQDAKGIATAVAYDLDDVWAGTKQGMRFGGEKNRVYLRVLPLLEDLLECACHPHLNMAHVQCA